MSAIDISLYRQCGFKDELISSQGGEIHYIVNDLYFEVKKNMKKKKLARNTKAKYINKMTRVRGMSKFESLGTLVIGDGILKNCHVRLC